MSYVHFNKNFIHRRFTIFKSVLQTFVQIIICFNYKTIHLTIVHYGWSNHTNHWPDRPFVQLLLENPDRQKHRGTEELPSQDPLLWHAIPIQELWPAKYFIFMENARKNNNNDVFFRNIWHMQFSKMSIHQNLFLRKMWLWNQFWYDHDDGWRQLFTITRYILSQMNGIAALVLVVVITERKTKYA